VPPLLLGAMAAAGVFLFFLGLASRPTSSAADMVAERLQSYARGGVDLPLTEDEIVLQQPFSDRFIRPTVERVGRYFAARTSEQQRYSLLTQLDLAGRPGDLSPEDFTVFRYAACVALFAVGLLLGALTGEPVLIVVFAAVTALMGFYGPLLWLRSRVSKRRREIQMALPDALDLLTIAVEAGLGLDAAIKRVTEKFQNALADEFAKVLQETMLGRSRLDALDEMGRRSGVEDLHNFVQAIIQSEQMGVGVARILRLQSDEIRRKRRQRAQEKAAQASLKMMLPMVGCIFPTLWIVLLGPAVLLVLKVRG